MSRVGKKPIDIPSGVEVKTEILPSGGTQLIIKGPKGQLEREIIPAVKVEINNNQILIKVQRENDKRERAWWGLFRALIANMVEGVTKGFEKQLEFSGVGFKVAVQGNKLVLNVGFSHPVDFPLPTGISAKVENSLITLNGIDRELLGETAANIRKIKKPEPYKGKGIKYATETIRRKAGKAAKSAA